jgi:16S rRNA (cytosine1402-N4)-methyltransferase
LNEPTPHRRRPRYSGKNPRRFSEKYKELDPEKHPETIAKVLASGKTPAGSHVPIMVGEILAALNPQPGELAVDCTLGHGGHTRELLHKILPGGRLIGLDADPIELPRTEAILRGEGFGEDCLVTRKSNFAGIQAALASIGADGADMILADLGVSSMQLDNPARGFTSKHAGPLDMRMNPAKGIAASKWLERVTPAELAEILRENSDEPHAQILAPQLAAKSFSSTLELAQAIRAALSSRPEEELKKSSHPNRGQRGICCAGCAPAIPAIQLSTWRASGHSHVPLGRGPPREEGLPSRAPRRNLF